MKYFQCGSSDGAALIGWLVVFFCLGAGMAFAEETDEEELKLQYYAVQTNDLRLIYAFEDNRYILPHMARCFENSFQYHQRVFNYKPSEEVTIFLNDSDDYGYAGTTTIPNNWITLGIEPFESVFETCPTNERMNWVMSHELLHVVASDQATGSDAFYRKVFFGKVPPNPEDPLSIFYSYLTNPRRYAPRWYHEGIAVFMETWMAGGMGRSLGGWDEMAFRAMVLNDKKFYGIVGIESEGTAKDFQIGQVSYLYGTRFVNYVAYLYGPEKVLAWIRRDEGSKRSYAGQFKNVFGVPIGKAWSEWVAWEHAWQDSNLATLRQYPITEYRALSERGLGSVSRAYYNPEERKIYAGVNYPGSFAHLAEIDIDTGKSRKICDIPTPALYYVAGVAYDPDTQTLFYTTDNSRQWRDINAVDIRSGKSRVLLANCRTGNLAFNQQDKSIWGVQHHNGKSRLVRVPQPYDDWQELLVLPYGKDLIDIDVDPEGLYVTGTLTDINGRQRLIRMEVAKLLMFDSSYDVLWEFTDNAPLNFVFSPDGKYLYGSTYLTGVSNVFRFDMESMEMKAVSNCETGYFRPMVASADSLIAFRYTDDGFVPVMIADQILEDVNAVAYFGQAVYEKHPELSDWMLGSPREVNLDSLKIYDGDYKGFKSMYMTSAYPIVEGYKEFGTVGMRGNFMDPLGLYGLDMRLSYTPNINLPSNERIHFSGRFRHWPWTITAFVNRADFYDLFGPTKISRKGYALGLGYENYLVMDRPRRMSYGFNLSAWTGLEKLPDYQNIAASYENLGLLDAYLEYENQRRTIGGVEKEKGIAWRFVLESSYLLRTFYPGLHYDLDYGILTPWKHSSLWFRGSVGHFWGDRSEPSANFYFGGFGNNYVDHRNVNRYREYYAFPGVPLNYIDGKNYGKIMLEWAWPPLRFRRVGIPSLYFTWMRLVPFTTLIVTNMDLDEHRREVVNYGAQLNMKLVLFSSLKSTFSVGYARAVEDKVLPSDEWMFSLAILQ